MSNIISVNWNIGTHVPYTKQSVYETVKLAVRCGMYTMQFFFGSPYVVNCYEEISESEIERIHIITERFPICIVTHFPYVANFAGKGGVLAHNVDTPFSFTLESWSCKCGCGVPQNAYIKNVTKRLEWELKQVSRIGGLGVVIHPGSHPNRDKGHRSVSRTLSSLVLGDNITSLILLENCAGEGNKLCRNPEELAYVIDNMTLNKDKVGICIDTAHLWGVGEYDLRDVDEIDRFIDDMERYGIMDRWKLLHLNDSGVPFGSHKDRHASIGTGYIWNKNVTSLIYLLDKCNRFGINIVMETCLEDMIFISELNYLV